MKIDIEDIRKVTKDKNAWYLICVPVGTCQDELMAMKRILDDSGIPGLFIIVTADYSIEEIDKFIYEEIK